MAVQIGQRAVRVTGAHRELFEGGVVGDREIDCLLVLWRDFQPIHHHVVEPAIEARDQRVPVVLHQPRVATHAFGDSVDDLLLEADQLGIVRWIGEGIGGVGFGIRAECQLRRLRRRGPRPQQEKDKQYGAHGGLRGLNDPRQCLLVHRVGSSMHRDGSRVSFALDGRPVVVEELASACQQAKLPPRWPPALPRDRRNRTSEPRHGESVVYDQQLKGSQRLALLDDRQPLVRRAG